MYKDVWKVCREFQVCSINDEFEWSLIVVVKCSVVVMILVDGIGLSVKITWTTKLRCKRVSHITERSPEKKNFISYLKRIDDPYNEF